MYEYRCTLRRVIDGDTIDVDIDLGFKVIDQIEDLPLDLDGWKPKNYNKKYAGSITLEESFAISSNIIPISAICSYQSGNASHTASPAINALV